MTSMRQSLRGYWPERVEECSFCRHLQRHTLRLHNHELRLADADAMIRRLDAALEEVRQRKLAQNLCKKPLTDVQAMC